MKSLVSDPSLLLDLMDLGILHPFFKLQYRVYVPSMDGEIGKEEMALLHPYATDGKLVIHEPSNEERIALQDEVERIRILNDKDLSAAFIARKEEAILLTRNGRLREYGEKEGVEVRDQSWILDRMVEEGQLDRITAGKKLDRFDHQVNDKLGVSKKE